MARLGTTVTCAAAAALLLLLAPLCCHAEEEAEQPAPAPEATGRVLPIFNVVQFPNSQCLASNSNNGTCYTSTECTAKGGTASGTCASSFGVCCTFTLSCGGSSSENNTYIYQAGVTTLTSPCTYTICKCSTNICRIRFSMATFTLAGPTTGTTVTASAPVTVGASIGDCQQDMFAISGTPGTQTICGTNAGAHMIVDASDDCHKAVFSIGALTTTTRTWHMHVTQYACNSMNIWGGPPGCLQYFTALTGTLTSFNFPTAAPYTASVTHLSSQQQSMCIRRTASYCYICYRPSTITSTSAAVQASFGLSVSPSGPASQAGTGAACTSDFVDIPGLTTLALAATIVPPALSPTSVGRICGRFFGTAAATSSTSMCTRSPPFSITFRSDADEANVGTANTNTNTNEIMLFTGGIVGFSIGYVQTAC